MILTFELRDLSCGALRESLVAGVTGQRHGNATAAQQESNLLTAGILLEDKGRGRIRPRPLNILQCRFIGQKQTTQVPLHRLSSTKTNVMENPAAQTQHGGRGSREAAAAAAAQRKAAFCCSSNQCVTMPTEG